MKFLIWGTGSLSQRFIDKHINDFFSKNEIVAFIDSNEKKTGDFYFNKSIIHPRMISECSYDYIIICSSYFQEIHTQLLELGISDSSIYSATNSNQLMLDYYEKNYRLSKKRILVLGDEDIYRAENYESNFHVVANVDILKTSEISKYQFDYILIENMRRSPKYDAKKGLRVMEQELKLLLSNQYGISKDRILGSSVYSIYVSEERHGSYGYENANKTFLVIQFNNEISGLGSILVKVNMALSYAQEKGYILIVDMMTYPNQYLEKNEIGRINAWEKFFEQPCGYSLKDIEKSKNIVFLDAANNNTFDGRIDNYYSKIKIKPNLKEQIDNYAAMLFGKYKKILGVLFRGTDYANLKPYGHPIQPNLEMMIETVRSKLTEWDNYDCIYLCTEVSEALTAFKEEFSIPIESFPQKRYKADTSSYLAYINKDESTAYQRGADYFSALIILSKCDSLISGNCSGRTVSVGFNNEQYNHNFVFSLGAYGIENTNR